MVHHLVKGIVKLLEFGKGTCFNSVSDIVFLILSYSGEQATLNFKRIKYIIK